MKRVGSAEWQGDIKSGKGTISTESGALKQLPYSFSTRFGEEKGSNPEELLGAAHAACFSMALSGELAKASIAAKAIKTSSTIEIRPQPAGGFAITTAHLTVVIEAPGAARDKLETAAKSAELNCPLSKVMKAEISMDLTCQV